MVSREAITALKPVSLEGNYHYDKGEITWVTSNEVKTTTKTQEVVLVAEIPGETYLIVILTERQSGGGDDDQQPSPPPPFTLSSFLAPSLPPELRDQRLVLQTLPSFLQTGPDASLDVIVSVRSGTGLSSTFYDVVLQPLLGLLGLRTSDGGEEEEAKNEGNPYSVTFTKDADTVKNFARERWGQERGRKKRNKETVILLSGDGGIVDLLSGIQPPSSTSEMDKDTITPSSSSSQDLPTVVVLPLGTGNALFHSLHKPHYNNNNNNNNTPSPLVLALRALLQGRPAPLPTFQASFHPAAHPVAGADVLAETALTEMTGAIVASYGFHAQLVWESDTPAYRVHGAKRFGMVAQELLSESHAYHAVVETTTTTTKSSSSSTPTTTTTTTIGRDTGDNNNSNNSYFNYILTTLCSNLEKTFTISPESKPLDGMLRLVHFGGADGKRTMEIMGAAYNEGRHVGMEGVGYEAIEAIKVTTLEDDARWRKVCIDGTIVELPKEGSMTVRRSPVERLQVTVLDA